jgi:hypothetical protein
MRAARHGFGVRSTASSAQARRTWSCDSMVADPRRPRLSLSPKSRRVVSEVNPNYSSKTGAPSGVWRQDE